MQNPGPNTHCMHAWELVTIGLPVQRQSHKVNIHNRTNSILQSNVREGGQIRALSKKLKLK